MMTDFSAQPLPVVDLTTTETMEEPELGVLTTKSDDIYIDEDGLDTDQARAVQLAVVGHRTMFISGPGGAGKSFVIRHCVAGMHAEGRRVQLVVPTGIAGITLGLGARTMHSLLALRPVGTLPSAAEHIADITKQGWGYPKIRLLRQIDVLIIDEISMVSAEMVEFADAMFRRIRRCPDKLFGGLQVVVVGDFCQLAPINARFAFESKLWADIRRDRVLLQRSHRHGGDARYGELLGRVRIGEQTEEDFQLLETRVTDVRPDSDDVTFLFGRNAEVIALNTNRINRLDATTQHRYTIRAECDLRVDTVARLRPAARTKRIAAAKSEMLRYFHQLDHVELRVGARVMLLTNKSLEEGMANGSVGRIVGFTAADYVFSADDNDAAGGGTQVLATCGGEAGVAGGWPIVKFDGVSGRRIIGPHAFEFNNERDYTGTVYRLPLTLAWALTIHKSQSISLPNAVIDLRRVSVTNPGQAYVALSRVRTLAGVIIWPGFDREVIRADARAVAESVE